MTNVLKKESLRKTLELNTETRPCEDGDTDRATRPPAAPGVGRKWPLPEPLEEAGSVHLSLLDLDAGTSL